MNAQTILVAMLPEHLLLVGICLLLCMAIAPARPRGMFVVSLAAVLAATAAAIGLSYGGYAAEPFAGQYSVDPEASLGKAMAVDPAIAECAIARTWNWAMGKTDIVDTLQEVPHETIAEQVTAFTANGFKMKDLIYGVFTADDFVKFSIETKVRY